VSEWVKCLWAEKHLEVVALTTVYTRLLALLVPPCPSVKVKLCKGLKLPYQGSYHQITIL